LFARHVDNLSGRLPPPYVTIHSPTVLRQVPTDPPFPTFPSTLFFSLGTPTLSLSSSLGVSSEGGVRFLSVWSPRLFRMSTKDVRTTFGV
jgi:hypothetical protein